MEVLRKPQRAKAQLEYLKRGNLQKTCMEMREQVRREHWRLASNVDGELALSKRETAFAPTTYKLIFVSQNLPCFDLVMGCFH